jgi:hypothetical protein
MLLEQEDKGVMVVLYDVVTLEVCECETLGF